MKICKNPIRPERSGQHGDRQHGRECKPAKREHGQILLSRGGASQWAKRASTLLLLCLALAAPTWAQVVQGDTLALGDADGCTFGTDCTVGPFSVPAGSNRLAIVSTFVTITAGWGAETATLGGATLTAINRSPASGGGNVLRTWCLLDEDFPSTGDQSVVVGGGGGGGTSPTRWSAIVTFYTNAEQTCPITNATASDGSGTAPSNALTPVATGSIFQHVVGIAADRFSTLAATSPQVIPTNGSIMVTSRPHAVSMDTLDVTTEATAEFTWTSSANYFSSAFIIEPAAAETTPAIADAGVFTGPWPPAFEIQPLTLADAEEETAYTGATPLVQGGASPFTWAVVGSLPSGLSMASGTGIISGTPAAASAGTYPFTVKVTDDGGGLAFRTASLTVQDAGGDSLAFYEDAEDGNLTATPTWTSAGGCSVSANGFMEGAEEIAKTASTDCVAVDNIDAPEVFFGFDLYRNGAALPDTDRDQIIVGLGASDEFLFSCRVEIDFDLWCKTAGQTENSNRGHFVIQTLAADTSKYVECHFATGTGADAVFRCRVDGGTLKEFSAGTATANVDRIIFRDENDDAAQDFFFDRFEIKDTDFPGRGPLTPPGPPDEPWINDFLPIRTHYVDDISCGGVGTIGDPECPGTAFSSSHYQCGDLHILRAGSYLQTFDFHTEFSRDCTSSNPAVFKGYVDPATGQPENAKFRPQIQNPGAWNWFVNLHGDGEEDVSLELSTIRIQDAGNHLINNVLHDSRGSIVRFYSNSGATPDMVMYGNVLYGAGPGNNGAHNTYTQNDCTVDGRKYYVHQINLDPRTEDGGRRLFQANDSGGGNFVCGYWLEGNFFADRNPAGDDPSVIWTGATQETPDVNLIDNYFVDFYQGPTIVESVRMGAGPPVQAVITGNYFAKANMSFNGYWGNSETHDPIVFTGNEIYDPPGGSHIRLVTRGISGSAGTHKINDADDVDNNTYGGTFKAANLECNNSDFTNLTLTQWRTNTDNCRVTPDAGDANGFDLNSTTVANPTVNKIEVIQNQYQCPACVFTDGDWGLIYIVNWENVSSDIVDISSVVGPGKDYTIRYPKDFFGTAAASGTCPGSGACNVSLPTRRTSAEAAGEFANAYVITAEP